MSDRRFFSSREHVALFLAADGRCAECGIELEPGWHADHVDPHSRGGATDVVNGQALCPRCNLKKGATVSDLRAWQAEALRKFDANRKDFLVVATPGAGKTTVAVAGAQSMISAGEVTRIIVVVPTSHLRRQWSDAAARHGLQLDSKFANGAGAIAKDYDGVVITYATVASEPLLWRHQSASARTLVILDEIHHAGEAEHLSWGPALRSAFEPAVRRLMLSGTPFRSDGAAIPFVSYDDAGRCVPSHEYGYREALQDRDVVRPIEFPVLDGTMRWRLDKRELETELSTADDKTMAQALTVAIDPDSGWMPSVLRRADEELTRVRETMMPDAGGLVIAAEQTLARRYVTILRQITGEKPALAITDEPDASDNIKQFAAGTSRWIVAVQMVSEGVDIPRLAVGVYASRYRTRMFFRQVAGRFVRMRNDQDETYASLFIPAIEPLVRYAREIEETAAEVLREQSEPKEGAERELRDVALFDLVEATEAVHTSTVVSGQTPSEAELRRAMAAMTAAGITGGISVAQAALLLRAGGMPPVVGTVQVSVPKSRSLVDEKARLRQVVSALVGKLGKASGADYKRIHFTLNQHFNEPSINQATVDSLRGRIEILKRWISEA